MVKEHYIKRVILLFFLLLLGGCHEQAGDAGVTDVEYTSRLDAIFGDKVIDAQTKNIRRNNFERLRSISQTDLKAASRFYYILSLGEGMYLIKQKKSYTEARCFNLLLKFKNEQLQNYFVLNDFTVCKLNLVEKALFLLCGDWENRNSYWQAKQQIKLLKLDDNLQPAWKYEAFDARFPLRPSALAVSEETVFTDVEVITGCHMCYIKVRLELDRHGGYKTLRETEQQHAHSAELSVLKGIFSRP